MGNLTCWMPHSLKNRIGISSFCSFPVQFFVLSCPPFIIWILNLLLGKCKSSDSHMVANMKLSLLHLASGKGKGDPQNREPSGNNCATSTKYHRGKIKQSSKQNHKTTKYCSFSFARKV